MFITANENLRTTILTTLKHSQPAPLQRARMPVSLNTQTIQVARASGWSITAKDQPEPYSAPVVSQHVHFAEAETWKHPERAGNHATSSPIANSRRFPPRVILTLEHPPPGLRHAIDTVAGYRVQRTGGLGRDLHATRAIDLPKFNQNISIWQGPFPAKDEEEEFDPNKFYARPLMRKNVPITGLQWVELWTRERDFSVKAKALDHHIENLERLQKKEQDHDALMFAKHAGEWELDNEHEWRRRDYQAEKRLKLEKEEYDGETQGFIRTREE